MQNGLTCIVNSRSCLIGIICTQRFNGSVFRLSVGKKVSLKSDLNQVSSVVFSPLSVYYFILSA